MVAEDSFICCTGPWHLWSFC